MMAPDPPGWVQKNQEPFEMFSRTNGITRNHEANMR